MGKPVLIGDFLHRIKRPVELVLSDQYKLVTIKLKHNGVVLRHEKLGSEIKSKMFEVKEGDFILSGIDARNGAFGIVPKDLDGAIVTNDFWYFDIDEGIVDKHFFLELTTTLWFDEICRKGSDGTTQRIRLQKNKFFNQEIFLPELDEQREFIEIFKRQKNVNSDLSIELTQQQTLLKKLRQQILQEAIEGKLTEKFRMKNKEQLRIWNDELRSATDPETIRHLKLKIHNCSESAASLLQRIKVEKEQLIKDKKIKKGKKQPASESYKGKVDIPPEWKFPDLDDITQYITDGTHQTPTYTSNGRMFLSAQNIKPFRFMPENHRFVSESAYQDYIKNRDVDKGEATQLFFCKIEQALIFLSGEELHAHHRTG
jgi:restriction endonuclease S subunit